MFEKCHTQFFSLVEQCHTQRPYVSLCAIFNFPNVFFSFSSLLEEGCPSSAEVIEDTKGFIQLQVLYSLFFCREISIFERFLKILV